VSVCLERGKKWQLITNLKQLKNNTKNTNTTKTQTPQITQTPQTPQIIQTPQPTQTTQTPQITQTTQPTQTPQTTQTPRTTQTTQTTQTPQTTVKNNNIIFVLINSVKHLYIILLNRLWSKYVTFANTSKICDHVNLLPYLLRGPWKGPVPVRGPEA
jgi:hypothetical protein